MKRVLDVGQCAADHFTLRRMLESKFQSQVTGAIDALDALSQLRAGSFDLVLVNRLLDADASPGLDIIRAIKSDPQLATIPVMLVSNYVESQQQAISAGAEPGFGKAQTHAPDTIARLSRFLA
jgi:CheY-like chemotaxis protein